MSRFFCCCNLCCTSKDGGAFSPGGPGSTQTRIGMDLDSDRRLSACNDPASARGPRPSPDSAPAAGHSTQAVYQRAPGGADSEKAASEKETTALQDFRIWIAPRPPPPPARRRRVAASLLPATQLPPRTVGPDAVTSLQPKTGTSPQYAEIAHSASSPFRPQNGRDIMLPV